MLTREKLAEMFKAPEVQKEASDPMIRAYEQYKAAASGGGSGGWTSNFANNAINSMFGPQPAPISTTINPGISYINAGLGSDILKQQIREQASQIAQYESELAKLTKPMGFGSGIQEGWKSMKHWGGKALPYVGLAGGIAGAGYLIDRLMDRSDRQSEEAEFESAFNSVKADPEIKKLNKQNVQDYLDALRIFSPEIAKKPNLAKSYLMSSMGYGTTEALDPSRISEMSRLRNSNGYVQPQRRMMDTSNLLRSLGQMGG